MNNRLFVDFHVLQTVPPSCVNRDDTGRPKTAVYGGTTRARVSSQSWKHAIREYFTTHIPEFDLGKRTKRIVGLVADAIHELRADLDEEKTLKMAEHALKNAGLKIKSADKGTDALFFISNEQVKALAELAVSGETGKKKYAEALKIHPSIDMVMFGRMVASDPSLNYDATVQVAHSISTHTVHTEYDYFTAVDDCSSEDNAGAGHLGTTEFNSATLYRYATINVSELKKFAGERTAEAVSDFARAFVQSMPTGKINAYANFTVPDDVYITVRRDQPINLCGAFERPVRSKAEGYVKGSESAFNDYTQKVYTNFAEAPAAAFGTGDGTATLIDTEPLSQVFDDLQTYLEKVLRSVQ